MKCLVICMDLNDTAPGIVFKTLLADLTANFEIDVISPCVDYSSLPSGVKVYESHFRPRDWRKEQISWGKYGKSPNDEKWCRRVISKYSGQILKAGYDRIITFVSNGYYASLDLGNALKKLLGIEWIIYSVDGIPAPSPWFDAGEYVRNRIIAHICELCSLADVFVSSNAQMIEYEKSVLKKFHGRWEYLYTPYKNLPRDFSLKSHSGFNIVYAGSLYGLRNVDGMIGGFRLFRKVRPDARLTFAGPMSPEFEELLRPLAAEGLVEILPYTKDIMSLYATADVLVDIAADIPDDVFLSSKIICYLPVNLPILAISGANSPSRNVMSGLDSIVHCPNDAREVSAALAKCSAVTDFSDRSSLLDTFDAKAIAQKFVSIVLNREKIVLTLTSWRPRYRNLPQVLDSIFAQTLPPDTVCLNVAEDDAIPRDIQDYLDAHKVEIHHMPDTRVYKKLLPTLRRYPDACVISIDDDWIYPPGMIEEFMSVHHKHPDCPVSGNSVELEGVACHCGCASLTKASYFGRYLDLVDDDVIANCKSDDIVYTYLVTKNGCKYIHTDNLYYENMKPVLSDEAYSPQNPERMILDSWEYLHDRFGNRNDAVVPVYKAVQEKGPSLLVVFHAYYSNQIPFFIKKMANVNGCHWDLAVTFNELAESSKNLLREFNPDTKFIKVNNVGYDVFPFLSALSSVDLGGYDYVLKLQTKSASGGKGELPFVKLYGYRWRNLLVNALLADKARFRSVLRQMSEDPSLAIACSEETIVDNPLYNFLDEDFAALKMMSERGLQPRDKRFCAGTMFLCRAASLYPVLKLNHSEADFAVGTEKSHSGGTLAHVYERLFFWMLSAEGGKIRSYTSVPRLVPARFFKKIFSRLFAIDRFGASRSKYLIVFGVPVKLDEGHN